MDRNVGDALPRKMTSVSDYHQFQDCDLRAYGLASWGLTAWLRYPQLRYQRLMRRIELVEALGGSLSRYLGLLMRVSLKRQSVRLGISIPPGCFGPGLSVPHYGSVVVNEKVRAGAFCRVHTATNIGERDGSAPILGDFVYIGPGAVLAGAISVGTCAAVGANSVVLDDVLAGKTVVGAPARAISNRGSRDVMPDWVTRVMPDY